MKHVVLYICLMGLLFPYLAKAQVVGREGQTYQIRERDMRDLIQEKADSFDHEGWKLDQQKRISDTFSKFRPQDAVSGLPPSQTGEAYQVDLTYSLPYDITDLEGNVIYPKGYTFNPLELMTKKGMGFSKILVVVNGEREPEIKWLQNKFEDLEGGHIMVMITDGYALELSERLKRPVVYLPWSIKERFVIRETPSVIVQTPRKHTLTVKPYALDYEGREMKQSKKKR